MSIYDIRNERVAAAACLEEVLLGYIDALQEEARYASAKKRAVITEICTKKDLRPEKIRILAEEFRLQEKTLLLAEQRKNQAMELVRLLA